MGWLFATAARDRARENNTIHNPVVVTISTSFTPPSVVPATTISIGSDSCFFSAAFVLGFAETFPTSSFPGEECQDDSQDTGDVHVVVEGWYLLVSTIRLIVEQLL